MTHRPRPLATLLVALLLSVAAPAAAIQAADIQTTDATPLTPLNTNLVHNAGFESIRTDGSLKSWTVEGDVHTETFGTKAWPYPAYGAKYHGGRRYLTCGKGSGLVRQTIPFNNHGVRGEYHLRARLQADFGGVRGHQIRVSIHATGTGADGYRENLRVLDVTNHYKEAFTAITIPDGTNQLEVTVELLPKAGASSCRMVADSVKLDVIKF